MSGPDDEEILTQLLALDRARPGDLARDVARALNLISCLDRAAVRTG